MKVPCFDSTELIRNMNAHLEIILAHCDMRVSTGANHLFFGFFQWINQSHSFLYSACLYLDVFLPTRKLKVLDHSRYEKLLTNIRKNDVILLHTTVVLDFQTCEWETSCES